MTQFLRTAFLLGALSLLLLAMGQAVAGREGLVIAFVLTLIMNFGSYWFSDSIVLKMQRAVPISREQAPEIFSMTEALAQKAGIPSPKLYWVASASPNAFATGRNPRNAAIALTQGLVQSLNRDELRGVIAHEMGHIVHRDTLTATIAATLAGTVSFLAMMLRGSLLMGGHRSSRESQANPVLLLLFVVLMPIAAAIIQMAVSRTREYAADDQGAELSGNPLYLASALQKISIGARRAPMTDANPAAAHLFIVSPLAGVNFAALFSTHPPVEKRIARLEAMARP